MALLNRVYKFILTINDLHTSLISFLTLFCHVDVILAYPCCFPFIWGMAFALNQSNQMGIGLILWQRNIHSTRYWINIWGYFHPKLFYRVNKYNCIQVSYSFEVSSQELLTQFKTGLISEVIFRAYDLIKT